MVFYQGYFQLENKFTPTLPLPHQGGGKRCCSPSRGSVERLVPLTRRGEKIRIISARRSRKEGVVIYEGS
jgi:hypothetical protein